MANGHLLAQFMLALEIKFEGALHFHNEGYEGGDDYGQPKMLIRSAYIYLVSPTAETSFNSTDYKGSTTPTSLLTLK